MTFAPIIAVISSLCNGFIIAEVIPAPAAIDKKAAFIPCRLGKPKEIFDARTLYLPLALCADAGDQIQCGAPRHIDRPNRHDQRVNHNIFARDTKICRPFNNFPGHIKADICILGDTGFIISISPQQPRHISLPKAGQLPDALPHQSPN